MKSKRKRLKLHSEAPDFTSQEFFRTLYEKAMQSYYKASLLNQGAARLPKNIISDPAFKAIEHCQTWHQQIQYYDGLTPAEMTSKKVTNIGIDPKDLEEVYETKILPNLRRWARNNYDPRQEAILAREFVEAAKSGNIGRLETLTKLCSLHKIRALGQQQESKRYPIPWHYYIGVNACAFLGKGSIPTKKQLKEAAIQHRAVDELRRQQPTAISLDVAMKIEEITKQERPNWTRIFRDLDLTRLPSAPTHRAVVDTHQ